MKPREETTHRSQNDEAENHITVLIGRVKFNLDLEDFEMTKGDDELFQSLYAVYKRSIRTRGQWSYRPASTRAMINKHMILNDFFYFVINIAI